MSSIERLQWFLWGIAAGVLLSIVIVELVVLYMGAL